MIIGLEFLSSIDEHVFVVADEEKREFSSGSEAKEYYKQAPGKYSVKRIQIEDGIIAIYIRDKTKEIEANYKKWMQEETGIYGKGPSFF